MRVLLASHSEYVVVAVVVGGARIRTSGGVVVVQLDTLTTVPFGKTSMISPHGPTAVIGSLVVVRVVVSVVDGGQVVS